MRERPCRPAVLSCAAFDGTTTSSNSLQAGTDFAWRLQRRLQALTPLDCRQARKGLSRFTSSRSTLRSVYTGRFFDATRPSCSRFIAFAQTGRSSSSRYPATLGST